MHKQFQTEITKLMQKDMDRREFLKHVGFGFAGIMGLTSILKALSSLNGPSQGTPAAANSGYGSSAYGGNKNNTPRRS
jgi:hypothetical protein